MRASRASQLLHDSELAKAHVPSVPPASICPAKELAHYTSNDDYQPPQVSWIWHACTSVAFESRNCARRWPPCWAQSQTRLAIDLAPSTDPYSAIAGNTWVEIIHESDPFGDEKHGAWFLYTPGSGIYFNTGNTISFAEHVDAYKHFGISGVADYNSAMSAAAAAQGYDSVQFLAHVDHVSYQCDTKNTGVAGFDYMGLEIVATKMVGTYACGAASGAPTTIKRGWDAQDPCKCDNTKQFMNCAGTPTMRTGMTAALRAGRRSRHRSRTVVEQAA